MQENETRPVPLLPLRNMVAFPFMVLHFDVGRGKSITALEEAMLGDQTIFLVMQRDVRVNDPEQGDLYEMGTLVRIKQMVKLPGEAIRVLVEGISRAKLLDFTQTEPYVEARVEVLQPEPISPVQAEAFKRIMAEAFDEYVHVSTKVNSETIASLNAVEDLGRYADLIATNVFVKPEDKQAVLEEADIAQRLETAYATLRREIEIHESERRVHQRVRRQIEKTQREYYLREQMRAIQRELGEKDGGEIEEFQKKVADAHLPTEALEKANKEIERLSKMPSGSPETAVIRTYLDWILDLPWDEQTVDNRNIKKAERVLEQDHYGLSKVKERVLEYLAVKQLTGNMKGPILCFVGPPGVGKTSIGRSIARALDRKFIRISLGGVRDEAEIRGHRRTYIGAIPGRIIHSMKLAGSRNPVLLLDEIDKLGNDFRGDPASALLEVLDAEQNYAFRDHYLELPFDLSRVMFVTTANTADTIPRALLDRMEVIEISGYTQEEKRHIARRHLLPKQLEENGLTEKQMTLQETALRNIIDRYTREAGVRTLERRLAAVCRKAARRIAEGEEAPIKVTAKSLESFLGAPRHTREDIGPAQVGIATGLAWTAVGGETLVIEVSTMPGTGKMELTGQLGDVMKESAQAGRSYIRAHMKQLGVPEDFYEKLDMHIHIPAGATPKDGPSAGITMATAMVSALTGVKVRNDLAMTGEMTLRGRVLPIGGLKEKVLAAQRMGIANVLIPQDNKRDLEEIPENILEKINIIPVRDFSQVLHQALQS